MGEEGKHCVTVKELIKSLLGDEDTHDIDMHYDVKIATVNKVYIILSIYTDDMGTVWIDVEEEKEDIGDFNINETY